MGHLAVVDDASVKAQCGQLQADADLRAVMGKLRLSTLELARLLGVTQRAVNMWLKADRKLPGPVKAYLRLLMSLPSDAVAVELHRLRQ